MLSAAPSVRDKAAMSAGDLEVGRHTGGLVFEDVAVVHPASRAVIGQPGDADFSLGGDVDRVFPGPERAPAAEPGLPVVWPGAGSGDRFVIGDPHPGASRSSPHNAAPKGPR